MSLLNKLTSRAFGSPVPLEETRERMGKANLAQYVFAEDELVGYTLNEHFTLDVDGVSRRVNYFTSAFLVPEFRSIGLYNRLNSLRLIGDEHYLLVRTQSPRVIASFNSLCEREGCRLFSPLSPESPSDVDHIVRGKFGQADLLCSGVYGRRLSTVDVVDAATPKIAKDVLARLDVDRGDACILAAQTQLLLQEQQPEFDKLYKAIPSNRNVLNGAVQTVSLRRDPTREQALIPVDA